MRAKPALCVLSFCLCIACRKGSLYSWPCLQKLAEAGQHLSLSPAFFSLLQRVMEDCLCDAPPTLAQLKNTPEPSGHKCPQCDKGCDGRPAQEDKSLCDGVRLGSSAGADIGLTADPDRHKHSSSSSTESSVAIRDKPANEKQRNSSKSDLGESDTDSQKTVKDSLASQAARSSSVSSADCEKLRQGSESVKRPAPDSGEGEGLAGAGGLKRLKVVDPTPAPHFYYSVHSKRLAKSHLPK